MLDLLAQSPTALIVCCGVLGLLVGSFLNVVIYRLPVMMDREMRAEARDILGLTALAAQEPFTLLRPRSRCGSCQRPIPARWNIPVLGWILLRGKAACCGAKLPIRYPMVEVLTGVLSALVAYSVGYSIGLALALVAVWLLIALAFIDYDTQLLPDSLNYPLMWLGLLATAFAVNPYGLSLQDAVIGAAAGYLSLWGVAKLFAVVTGRVGMGNGDFKLLAALGGWMGWQALPEIIVLSSGVGTALAVLMMLNKSLKSGQYMPFGPYLAGAGMLLFLGLRPVEALMRAWGG